MYKIIFCKNKCGKNEVEEYIKELSNKRNNSKDCKIKFLKIVTYINMLEKYGLKLNELYIKHIEGSIWELRPLRDRILFAFYEDNKFVLLSKFIKKHKKRLEKK